jgi:two-component system chemotaxis sensor kinase CheA
MATMLRAVRGAILVVDDDEDVRAEMRAVFEEEGYTVLEASDGLEALEVLHWSGSEVIGALILDLWMPRLSGWELLRILKDDQALSRIPVVVASALPVHGDASGIGATMHWLRKPFGSRELLDAVRTCGYERARRRPH